MPETRARRLGAWPFVLGTAAAGLVACAVGYAAATGDFSADGAALLANPWGFATLAEVYVAFMLFAGWICARERRPAIAAAWIVALLLVGGIVSGLYVILAARSAKGDAARFWMGPAPAD